MSKHWLWELVLQPESQGGSADEVVRIRTPLGVGCGVLVVPAGGLYVAIVDFHAFAQLDKEEYTIQGGWT